MTAAPPPLPPRPPLVLEYSHRPRATPTPHVRSIAGIMLLAGFVSGLIAVGLIGGMIELLIVTWPDFGAILLTVPILLGVLAFGTVSAASFRAAAAEVPPVSPRPSTPPTSAHSLTA